MSCDDFLGILDLTDPQGGVVCGYSMQAKLNYIELN